MRGFQNLPMWARLTIGLSVAAAMFTMIWWMHKEESKREATMMGLCWDVTGQAHYPEKWAINANCNSPTPLSWKKSPKLVYWYLDDKFDGYLSSHEYAMDFINEEIGSEHLIKTNIIEEADVIITHSSMNIGNGSMATSHKKIDDRIVATITVKSPGDIRRWMLEEQHEFGHVLGLAHDRTGIMNPDLDEGSQMRVWPLHAVDRDAILSSLQPIEPPGASVP